MLAGGLLALVHAFFAIHLRADQIVGGMAVNFLALGITGYFFFQLYNGENIPSGVSKIPNVNIPWIEHRHFLGAGVRPPEPDDLGRRSLLVIVSYFVVFKTPIGLRIRACGEHPRAADTVGINVYAVRYTSVVLSGDARGARRRVPVVGFGVGTFNENMTARPRLHRARRAHLRELAAVRGLRRGAALRLLDARSRSGCRSTRGSAATLFQALPYVLTLIAVAGVIGRSIPPAAVGRPYIKQ